MGDRFQYYYLNCAYVAQDYYAFPHASYMAWPPHPAEFNNDKILYEAENC